MFNSSFIGVDNTSSFINFDNVVYINKLLNFIIIRNEAMQMEKIKKLANELLKDDLEPGEKIYVVEVEPGIYYACVATSRRGPGSVIIGEDLSFLFGSSAFDDSQLVELYKKGERTKFNK